jgi:hypothetical protein
MNAFAPSVVAVLVFLALAPPASAGVSLNRAVCSVRLVPGASEGLGRSGGLVISTKATFEDCSDNFAPLQVHMLCTATPTSSNCTTDTRFHYSEAALLATYDVLVEARHALDTVDIFFDGTQINRGQQVRVGKD